MLRKGGVACLENQEQEAERSKKGRGAGASDDEMDLQRLSGKRIWAGGSPKRANRGPGDQAQRGRCLLQFERPSPALRPPRPLNRFSAGPSQSLSAESLRSLQSLSRPMPAGR